MSKIDHKYTDQIVCPYCGYEDGGSWEIMPGEEDIGIIDCANCDKSFYASRHISIAYTTEAARYGTCKCCGKEDTPIESHNLGSIGKIEDFCPDCAQKESDRLTWLWMELSK